jgi:hypothetical protein
MCMVHTGWMFNTFSPFVMQSRTTIVIHSHLKTSVFISKLFFISFLVPSFLSYFLHPMPYTIPLFLNVTVLHGSAIFPYQAIEKPVQKTLIVCAGLHNIKFESTGHSPSMCYVRTFVYIHVCVCSVHMPIWLCIDAILFSLVLRSL